MHFTCEATAGQVNVHIPAGDGPYHPWFKELQLAVYGTPSIREVQVDGKAVKTKLKDGTLEIGGIPWNSQAHDVHITLNPSR